MNKRFTRRLMLPCWTATPRPWLPDDTGGPGDAGAGGAGGGQGGDSGSGNGGPGGGAGDPQIGPHGFPERTPVAQMDPAHQAAYWRHHARKHEDEARGLRTKVGELEPAAARLAEIEEANRTEQEKAIARATKESRDAAIAEANAAARTTYGARLVHAELKAQLATKLEPDQITAMIAPLDVTKFLGEDGDVNTEAVTAYVASIPAAKGQQQGPRDLGQGRRGNGQQDPLAAGADLYAQRHPKRTTGTTR